jgi:hypothetical protein
VLMSILPSSIFSFACDLLPSTGLIVVAEGRNTGVAEGIFVRGNVRAQAFFSATKTLKDTDFFVCTFSRPALTPQPPIFSVLASSSSC